MPLNITHLQNHVLDGGGLQQKSKNQILSINWIGPKTTILVESKLLGFIHFIAIKKCMLVHTEGTILKTALLKNG